MSAENINNSISTDILSIMRELDRTSDEKQATATETHAIAAENAAEASKIDINPSKLLHSLRTKRDLLNVIGGHSEVKGINTIKREVNDAISFLTKLIDGDDAGCES